MENLLAFLSSQWAVIEKAPFVFLTGAVLIAGLVYAWVRHQFAERIASLDSRLRLRDDRIAEYERKLNASSPDEAKERIDRLEAQIAALQPRSLSQQQRDTIRKVASRHIGRLIVSHDAACSDCNRFAREISSVFTGAGWSVGNGVALGIGNPPDEGIAIRASDPHSPDAIVVQDALRTAGVNFAVQPRDKMAQSVEILVAAKIA